MKLRQNRFIVLCVLVALALCGAFAAIGCHCHDDAARHDEAASACPCDCICCGAVTAVTGIGAGSDTITSRQTLCLLDPTDDDDSGRLTESFIFTPPRA